MAVNLEWRIRLDDGEHIVKLWDDQQWGAFRITADDYIHVERRFRLLYIFSYTFNLCGHRCKVQQTMLGPSQTEQWAYRCLLDGKLIEPESSSLLRASQKPELNINTLLRPAHASSTEGASTLLRPEPRE